MLRSFLCQLLTSEFIKLVFRYPAIILNSLLRILMGTEVDFLAAWKIFRKKHPCTTCGGYWRWEFWEWSVKRYFAPLFWDIMAWRSGRSSLDSQRCALIFLWYRFKQSKTVCFSTEGSELVMSLGVQCHKNGHFSIQKGPFTLSVHKHYAWEKVFFRCSKSCSYHPVIRKKEALFKLFNSCMINFLAL